MDVNSGHSTAACQVGVQATFEEIATELNDVDSIVLAMVTDEAGERMARQVVKALRDKVRLAHLSLQRLHIEALDTA